MFSVMLIGFGALSLISSGLIMAFSFSTSMSIFSRMLIQRLEHRTDSLELAMRDYLDAAEHQASFTIRNVFSDHFTVEKREDIAAFAAGTLAAAPQVFSITLADQSGDALFLHRTEAGTVKSSWSKTAGNALLQSLDADMRSTQTAQWGEPVFSETLGAFAINYKVPVWHNGTYRGFVVVAVSTQQLSELSRDLSDGSHSAAFVLFGEDRVLAHGLLTQKPESSLGANRLPAIAEFPDPILQQLEKLSQPPGKHARSDVKIGEVFTENSQYGVLIRPVTGYGDLPLIVGAYFDGSDVAALIKSIFVAILICAAILIIGVFLVAWISRGITRPIRNTSQTAAAITQLEFESIDPLPAHPLREIDELANSFNAMLIALQSFGKYVPRKLVRRLIREHLTGSGIEERNLVVMFTDIAGFTTMCEGMKPADVAEFVNHHLTMVSKCIENEGGTIDKFIGDSVMAFWGAPESVDHPARRAMRAALATKSALSQDNQRREAKGLPKIHIRVGIHAGDSIVGDIGSSDRVNYTIIGDVVNTAQRLESLGKDINPEAEAIVLVSGSVREKLGDEFTFSDVGVHQVKGRNEKISVFELSESS